MNQEVGFENRRTRLAVVTSHPIQYQAPIWHRLAQKAELEVHVYFGSDFSVRGYRDSGFGVTVKWDVPLTAGYPFTFLSANPSSSGNDGFFSLRAANLRQRLREFKPDCALIVAYTPFFFWEALWILRSLHIPVMLRAETTDVAKTRTGIKRGARSLFLKLFYQQCAHFLAIGHNSRAHYVGRHIQPGRIGWSPYCIDTDHFDNLIRTWSPQRESLRNEFGFSNQDVILIFSGKLSPKKDPLILASALQLLPNEERSHIGLLVVGEGELRQEMDMLCHQALGDRAIFAGFVNQSQLGRYYAASDCLVLPSQSSETWGLVVNEALQFGIPAIVSERVGCHPDLVVEGKTGYTFPAGACETLSDRILKVRALLSNDRATLQMQCRQQVAGYTVQAAAAGILQGAQIIAGVKKELHQSE